MGMDGLSHSFVGECFDIRAEMQFPPAGACGIGAWELNKVHNSM